jgi:hypothetical protein
MPYFKNFPQIAYTLDQDAQSFKIVPNMLAKVRFNQAVIDNSSLYFQYDVKDGERPEDIAYRVYKDPTKHWVILIANEVLDPQYDWVLSQTNFEKYINTKYSSLTINLNPTETYTGNYQVSEIAYQGGNSVDQSSVEATVVSYNSTSKSLILKFANSTLATNVNITGVTSAQTHNVISVAYNNDGYNWASNTTSHFKVTERSTNSYDRTINTKTYKVSAKDYNHFSDSVFNRNTNVTTTDSYTLNDGSVLGVEKTVSPMSYYDYENELNEAKRKIKLPRSEFVLEIEAQFKRILGV